MDFQNILAFAANYIDLLLIILAFSLDLALGDPRSWPHPVVFMGRFIDLLERILRPLGRGPCREVCAGGVLTVFVVALTWLPVRLLLSLLFSRTLYLGYALAVYFLYTSFSLKSLLEHIYAVEEPLRRDDLPSARRALSNLVGRDTQALSAAEISRGAVESLAESSSDGVVAPLFYAFIGGAPLALAYKAINTLDSMLGYTDARYLYFGRVAAKLDDVANFIPARLTALFLLIAALTEGYLPWKKFHEYWLLVSREGKNHFSPNSGYPEAAAAVLLDVRLGGTSRYQGIASDKPLINSAGREVSPAHLKQLCTFVRQAARLALLAGILLTLVVRQLFFI